MLETMTRFPLKSAEFTRMSVRHFHQSPSKKNTPVRIMLCVYKMHPFSPLPRRGVVRLAFSVQVERHWRE